MNLTDFSIWINLYKPHIYYDDLWLEIQIIFELPDNTIRIFAGDTLEEAFNLAIKDYPLHPLTKGN